MGITLEQFWSLNPRKIKAIQEGNNNLLKQKDRENWINGQYTLSALITALDIIFNGAKAQSKYVEKPILEKAEEENKPLTKHEEKKQVDMFFQSLKVMQSNFELSKQK